MPLLYSHRLCPYPSVFPLRNRFFEDYDIRSEENTSKTINSSEMDEFALTKEAEILHITRVPTQNHCDNRARNLNRMR